MVVKSVMRYVYWRLDPDPEQGPPEYAAQCMTCEEMSPASVSEEEPGLWCLRHDGRTRHTAFRATITSFLRASMVDEASG